MAYADKRDGKLTGSWVGEAPKLHKKRRFKTKQAAEDYETFVKLMGREPPTIEDGHDSTGALTFAQVAAKAKEVGGPKGRWLRGRDKNCLPRLEYCVSVIGAYEIQRVTRAVLKMIPESLDNRPKAPGTAARISNATKNRYLAAAGAVLTYAFDEGLIPARPNVPLLDEKLDRKDRDILQLGQDEVILQLMRDAGHTVEALCVDALIQTGLRSGELLKKLGPDQVTIEQVEDEDGTVVLVGVIRLHKGQTKNDMSRVTILSADLAKQIKALIATGSMPTGWHLLKRFKMAVKRAGYTGNLVIHSLRHTRNTRLGKAGISKKIMMQQLGHMSEAANDIYEASDLQDHLQVAKKVAEYAGKRAKKATDDTPQVIDFFKRGAA